MIIYIHTDVVSLWNYQMKVNIGHLVLCDFFLIWLGKSDKSFKLTE